MPESSAPPLVLCCLSGWLTAWQLTSPPTPLLIQGQQQVTADASGLEAGRQDIVARLGDADGTPALIHWVSDARNAKTLQQATELQHKFPDADLQHLSWHWLAERLGFDADDSADPQPLLARHVLPWLTNVEDYASQRATQQAQLTSKYARQEEQLAAKRRRLEQENKRLHEQNAALQSVDAEALLHFLPALYPRIFNVIGATDLALLCHRIEPFDLPNPYREPSESTLRTLQRDFRRLPGDKQLQLIQFIERLPQRQKLTVRPEMRKLVTDIQDNTSCP